MSNKIHHFWSPELEAEFNAAYEAAMHQWPIPYDDLFVYDMSATPTK